MISVKLLDAAWEVFNMSLPGLPFAPAFQEDGTPKTFCNLAVNFVCNSAVNYSKFNVSSVHVPVTANAMYDLMADPAGDWIAIEGDVAQAHVNNGALVIAAQKNPAGHGHVCVLVPGGMRVSENYGKRVPIVMNVGKDVFIGKSVSFAFKTEPKYFLLKGSEA